jgi:L-iditol 2-dehydrogenase
MAEWIRVPGGIVQNDAFTVNNLTPEQALFIEPLACCVKALGCVRDGIQGSTGIVIGCGVMGMLNLLAARGLGADRLYAVEPDPERRRRALEFGADAALPPDAAAREWQHRADWVMVGPGHPEVIRQSLAYVRPAGVAVLFTPTATGVKTELELGELYFREITLIPSYSCGPSDTLKAYNLLKEADLQVERLITHGFPLEQAQTAFDTARRGGSVLKVIVQMSEASNL